MDAGEHPGESSAYALLVHGIRSLIVTAVAGEHNLHTVLQKHRLYTAGNLAPGRFLHQLFQNAYDYSNKKNNLSSLQELQHVSDLLNWFPIRAVVNRTIHHHHNPWPYEPVHLPVCFLHTEQSLRNAVTCTGFNSMSRELAARSSFSHAYMLGSCRSLLMMTK